MNVGRNGIGQISAAGTCFGKTDFRSRMLALVRISFLLVILERS